MWAERHGRSMSDRLHVPGFIARVEGMSCRARFGTKWGKWITWKRARAFPQFQLGAGTCNPEQPHLWALDVPSPKPFFDHRIAARTTQKC
jgi:hypothetical protein